MPAFVRVLAFGCFTTAACSLAVSVDGLSGAVGATSMSAEGGRDGSSGSSGASSSGSSGTGSSGSSGSPLPDAAPPTSYSEAVRADAPVLYLRLEETSGTVANDDMGHFPGNILVPVTLGAAGAIAGTRAMSLAMSGGITLGNHLDFDGSKPYTLEALINVRSSANAAYRRIFNKDERPAAGRQGYALYVEGSTATLATERIVDGSQTFVDTPISIGAWHHVVATYDGALLSLYIDGALADSTADGRAARIKNSDLLVGTNNDRDAAFDGTLDELAIYDTALTAARVKAHHDAR